MGAKMCPKSCQHRKPPPRKADAAFWLDFVYILPELFIMCACAEKRFQSQNLVFSYVYWLCTLGMDAANTSSKRLGNAMKIIKKQ